MQIDPFAAFLSFECRFRADRQIEPVICIAAIVLQQFDGLGTGHEEVEVAVRVNVGDFATGDRRRQLRRQSLYRFKLPERSAAESREGLAVPRQQVKEAVVVEVGCRDSSDAACETSAGASKRVSPASGFDVLKSRELSVPPAIRSQEKLASASSNARA